MTRKFDERKASNDAARTDRHIDWLSAVARCRERPTGEPWSGMLAEARVSTKPAWAEFRHFLIALATEWGKYGEGIWASIRTIAGDTGYGRGTVERYLTLAVQLGMLREVRRRTNGEAGKYEIAEWDWEADGPVLAEPEPARPTAVPSRVSEPEYDPDPAMVRWEQERRDLEAQRRPHREFGEPA
jgi:hypothetical protein